MKSKALKIILIVICTLIVAAALYFLINRDSWEESYQSDKKKPYDTYIIHELLFGKFKNQQNHEFKSASDSSLKEFVNSNLTYVFIGRQIYLDSIATAELITFVAQGNKAFISVDIIPLFLYNFQFIRDTIYSDTLNQENYSNQFQSQLASSINIKIDGQTDSLNFPFVYENQKINHAYTYLKSQYGLNKTVIPLGKFNNNLINFFSFDYGKGKFLIHTTPQTFTNYALSKENNLSYADFVFSHLKINGGIFWDEYNKNIHFSPSPLKKNKEEESPLRYILSQPALRIAWYLSLAFLLLYMIFVGKRRQRVIPVLEKAQNSSLEFIKTVGKLYYSERDHRGICMHKMKLFNNFLRNRYSINGNNITEELKNKISIVSGINLENINLIYSNYSWVEKQIEISDDELIQFNTAINNFYKQCK